MSKMLQRHSANAGDPMYGGERATTEDTVIMARRTLEDRVGRLLLSEGEVNIFD